MKTISDFVLANVYYKQKNKKIFLQQVLNKHFNLFKAKNQSQFIFILTYNSKRDDFLLIKQRNLLIFFMKSDPNSFIETIL